MYDLGTTAYLTVTLTDATDTPVSATGIVWTVTLPDGTTSTLTGSTVSTGVYRAPYLPLVVGHFSWSFTGMVGTTAVSRTDVFNVGPAFSGALISLDEAKAQVNDDDTVDDDEIRGYVRSATDIINARCGFSIPTIITETVSGTMAGSPKLVLSQTPVLSLTSITPQNQGVIAPSLSVVDLDGPNGILSLTNQTTFPSQLVVVYVAGRAYVPNALQDACKIIVQHMYLTQRGPSLIPGMGGDDTSFNPLFGYAVPTRAEELMRPYSVGPNV